MSKQKNHSLRFRQDDGTDFPNWQEKRLGEIAIVNPKSKDLPDEFVYIDLESVKKGMLVKESVMSKTDAPSRAQRLLKDKDILFQTVRPYQKNNYYFTLGKNYVASTGYAQLRAKESSLFLYQTLHTEKFVNAVLLRCTGTSYPAIHSTDLATIKIAIPSLPEQQKIASFLESVDTKIQLLERKVVLLQSYKKGIMQKLFSQKLHFKDEQSNEYPDWQERRLGEILEYEQPTKYIVDSSKYNDNYSIPVLTAGKTFILGYTNEMYGVFTNHPVIIFDDFTTMSKFVDFDFKAKSSAMKILKLRKNIQASIKLVYECMQKINFSLKGHKRYWISEYQHIAIPFPSLLEQQKISSFLQSLDTKISLTQKQVMLTKQYKKGLLQKMFV